MAGSEASTRRASENFTFRIDDALVRQLDALGAHLRTTAPGARWSRSDVLRHLIQRGLPSASSPSVATAA